MDKEIRSVQLSSKFPDSTPGRLAPGVMWPRLLGAFAATAIAAVGVAPASAEPIIWTTVANNADFVPGIDRTFNSYNPPSVNNDGLVVFRARTRGGQGAGQPATGIYARDMSTAGPITTIVERGGTVPAPNNTGATFNEFPAFARIDAGSAMIATRAQSNPVWQVTDPVTGETLTRVGTSGIYATPNGGPPVTAMSGLGAVPGFEQFQVPPPAIATTGIRFDQFPGAPSPFDNQLVAFKGNFTDETGSARTGVFYRDTVTGGGTAPAVAVAYSGQALPNGGGVFGSTAPPSAAQGQIVFTGLDNEDNPTAGGIYRARVGAAGLETLVSIGQTVPGVSNPGGTTLTRIGEALSFDGQRVAFWGAWGTETRTITLSCPSEGNAAVVAACNAQNPGGVTTREVPLNQGILLKDTVTGALELVAQTGSTYEDFLYWTFSGRPPGVGDGGDGGEDFEEPRWRSSAFVAADQGRVVFKASAGASDPFGLYLDQGSAIDPIVLLSSLMLGEVLDPAATGLPLTNLAVERDGFRNGYLAISASMADADTSWAGVYLTSVPVPAPASSGILASALAILAIARRMHRRA